MWTHIEWEIKLGTYIEWKFCMWFFFFVPKNIPKHHPKFSEAKWINFHSFYKMDERKPLLSLLLLAAACTQLVFHCSSSYQSTQACWKPKPIFRGEIMREREKEIPLINIPQLNPKKIHEKREENGWELDIKRGIWSIAE